MRTLELLLALVVMVTPPDPDIRAPLPLDCLQIKVPVVSLEQSRLNSDPTIAVILDGVMVTLGVGGGGVGVGVGVRVVVDTTVSITVSEASTSATVDVATTSSITEVAIIVGSVLEGMIIGGVVETSGGAAVEETAAGVDTATGVVDTAAHITVNSSLSNYLIKISKHCTILNKDINYNIYKPQNTLVINFLRFNGYTFLIHFYLKL